MESYDFSKEIDRRGTGSVKWEHPPIPRGISDVIPMWVADMDFAAPREVLDALHSTVSHGIFGYTEPSPAYFEALCTWFRERYDFVFSAEDVVKTPSVVVALAMCVRAYSKPGEAILIQSPVYYPFFHVIQNNGRVVVENPLRYENGAYQIDFEDFEQKLRCEKIQLFLLCSPHNPGSRVWPRGALERLHEICARHGVTVVADEIHCDLTFVPHTCYGTLDPDAIIATSASKTFNLAGLQAANIVVKHPERRAALQRELRAAGYSSLNPLAIAATQSAYRHGAAWLEGLKRQLVENGEFVRVFLEENLPRIKLSRFEGTYLLWLDFRAFGLPQKELERRVIEDARLCLSSGTVFGAAGLGFLRMNIACPRSVLARALLRLQGAFS